MHALAGEAWQTRYENIPSLLGQKLESLIPWIISHTSAS